MSLYKALLALKDKEDELGLDKVQRRIIDNDIRGMKNGGVGLNDEQRAVFLQLNQNLSVLSSKFDEHVLDSTKEYQMVVCIL